MKRFNLSEWAVTHRPMVLFLIIATLIVGVFSRCEFHPFSQRSAFRLRLPYVPIWDPAGYLGTLVIDEPPPLHEALEHYARCDEGLIWEMMDCIKWITRGRMQLAKSYLLKLGAAIGSSTAT